MRQAALTLTLLLLFGSRLPADDLGFRVPEGFHVSLYADDSLAHNIHSMTIDARGRIVVAGPGYVKILHDTDRDGRADKATLFSDMPQSGAHGMCFDGHDLICTGDNGVWRLRDRDGDGVCDSAPEKWSSLRHPDHGANGLVRGPDGWFYLICGNDAGVSEKEATLPGSPVKHPYCGAVVRYTPGGKQSEVFAHGFRNPYDLTFNQFGQVFTVDADGERDHHLPWYTPNRLFDIAQGMEHGWMIEGWTRSWNRPERFFDNVDRLIEIGRGSPTGLVVYRHNRFPQRYREGVYSICWTLGRIYFHHLKRHGGSYQGEMEIFMQTTGNVGFAPVDLAVSPQGDLFVAIGGRGTKGSVFRVRYGDAPQPPAAENDLKKVLAAPQPQSSWSRAQWLPRAQKLGRAPFDKAVLDDRLPLIERMRAVEVLAELYRGVKLAEEDLPTLPPELAARVAWSLGRTQSETAAGRSQLAQLSGVKDPLVARAVWEAVAATAKPWQDEPLQWSYALASDHRHCRWAALLAARGVARSSFEQYQQSVDVQGRALTLRERLNPLWVQAPEWMQTAESSSRLIRQALGIFRLAQQMRDRPSQLESVRLIQLGLGDLQTEKKQLEVYTGYVGKQTERISPPICRAISKQLASAFPSGEPPLDRELARVFCMLATDVDGLLPKLAGMCTEESAPAADVHYLIVASRIPGPRPPETTDRIAQALASLNGKLEARQLFPSRNWPLRVGEAFDHLLKFDPALSEALVKRPEFGSAEHAMFADRLASEARKQAAAKLFQAAVARSEEDEPAWTSELIRVVGELPASQVLPTLRENWPDPALQDSIALVLARHRQPEDRARLVAALGSAQPNVVSAAAQALAEMDGTTSPEELAAALKALRRFAELKPARDLRQEIHQLLVHLSGQEIAVNEAGATDILTAYQPWFEWFAKAHPKQAALLSGFGGAKAAEWKERLAAVDWEAGDTDRGQAVFEKKACHRCHVGARRLGPELRGVASRFSRDDLFVHIVEPSKVISPLYRTTMIVTQGGKVYTGMMVYASPDGTLLQTGPDTTVRITGDEVLARQPSTVSLMPTGLLNELSDQDLADLYAYLKKIGK